MSRGVIRVSPSAALKVFSCGRMYELERVLGYENETRSANLEFGSCWDEACTTFLIGQSYGRDIDPVPVFRRLWDAANQQPLKFPERYDKTSLAGIGINTLAKYVERWKERGLTVARMTNGEPMIQVAMTLEIGASADSDWHEVHVPIVIDVGAIGERGGLILIENKTAASAMMEGFERVAPQVTAYDLLCQQLARAGMIDAEMGYEGAQMIQAIKLKTKVRLVESPVASPRDEESIDNWIRYMHCAAGKIARKQFMREEGQSWCSPCRLCDVQKLCWDGDPTGLVCKKGEVYPLPYRPQTAMPNVNDEQMEMHVL